TTILPGEECYCVPTTGSNTGPINNVTITGDIGEDIENLNTGVGESDNGYSDYADQSVKVTASQDLSFEIDIEGDFISVGLRIWVDWNNDGSFSNDDEVVYQTDNYDSTFEGTFNVPEDAEGEYRMRIGSALSSHTGPDDPCSTIGGGEYEDYTIEVVALENCEGTPVAADVIEDFSICANSSFNLETEGATAAANNLIRVWQSSPAGEDDWTDLSEENQGSNITIEEGIEEDTDFRYKLQCDDGDSVYSDIINVTLNSANEFYCTPTTTGEWSAIEDFTATGDLGEDISNLGSGVSESGSGYSDFTDQVVQITASQDLEFSVSIAGMDTAGLKIWVDWGQDGEFNEDNELVFQSGGGYSSSFEGAFQIPEDANGEYRMRVGSSYTPDSGPNDACSNTSQGEYEDYTIEVVALEDCEGTPVAGDIMEDFNVCAGNEFTLETEGASAAANNLIRVWQSSPAGEEDWTDLSEENQGPIITIEEGIDEETDFRYKVQCEEDDPVYSDVVSVTLNPGNECYCVPEYTTG